MSTTILDAAAARTAGAVLLRPGPALSKTEVSDAVASIRAAAEASVPFVADVTQLPADPTSPTLVVDRATWLTANVEMVQALLADADAPDPATPTPASARAQIGRWASGIGNGAQVGALLAALSSRVLGQYLPFGQPRLLLVAPNIVTLERKLGLVPADFRLWVCLHEQTHARQFAQAPWLAGYLTDKLAELMAADEASFSWTRFRSGSLVDAVLSPAQRLILDRLTAVMSLLEGYADVMMDAAGPDVVPTVAAIRRAFNAHRARGGLTAVLNKALALDLKLAQYRDGAEFCRAVIARVGVPGLNAVYESPGLLPTLEEIHAPGRWLSRVHPDA